MDRQSEHITNNEEDWDNIDQQECEETNHPTASEIQPAIQPLGDGPPIIEENKTINERHSIHLSYLIEFDKVVSPLSAVDSYLRKFTPNVVLPAEDPIRIGIPTSEKPESELYVDAFSKDLQAVQIVKMCIMALHGWEDCVQVLNERNPDHTVEDAKFTLGTPRDIDPEMSLFPIQQFRESLPGGEPLESHEELSKYAELKGMYRVINYLNPDLKLEFSLARAERAKKTLGNNPSRAKFFKVIYDECRRIINLFKLSVNRLSQQKALEIIRRAVRDNKG